MRKQGLTEEQVAAVMSRDRDAIASLLGREFKEDSVGVLWFGGEMVITDVSPSRASRGTTLQVTVSGDYFPENAVAWFEYTTSRMELTNVTVTNALQHGSSLEGTLTIPSNAELGGWTVRVQDPDSGESTSMPDALTVLA